MPKNTPPKGGRPARNFDPSYAKSSSRKPGSRSAGHRGHRPDEAAADRKPRWSRDERMSQGRTPHRADRLGRDERPTSRFAVPERGAQRRDEGRPSSRFARSGTDASRNDAASGGRGAPRSDAASGGRGAPRSDASRDHARRYDRDETSARRYDREAYSPHRDDRDERRTRSFDRDDRPRYTEDRARRDDRAPRRFDRDDRAPRRDNDRDRHSGGRVAPRSGAYRDPRTDDRAPRRDDRDDRAPRRFDRDDRVSGGGPSSRFARSGSEAPRRGDANSGGRGAPRSDASRDHARRYDRDERPSSRFARSGTGSRELDRPGFRESTRRPSEFYPARDDRPKFAPQDDVVLERLEAQAIQAEHVDGVSFADLGLGQNVVRALADLGAEAPFPIQAATIPVVLEGRDVLGRGRTGSGKTIAFGAPTVERLMQLWAATNKAGGKRQMGRAPRALILAPTRELALQIDRTVQPIAQSVGLFTTQVYGGVPQQKQVGALRRGVDIVIGTPGRIEDLVRQGALDLSKVAITVLDEADHMCDLGFLEPVQRILRETSAGGQKLLFSATLDSGVAMLVEEFLVDPAVHEVAGEDQASGTIEHRVFVIENRDKRDIVAQLADRDGKTLVFSRTRAFAEDLTEHLEDAGIRAVALHGDLNQARRSRNLHQLTSGRVDVLVATDVAARGIHVDDIDLVIQADAPDEYKTYLHRSGRTGRAGRTGRVVTLIPRNRERRMSELLGRAEIDVEFEQMRLGEQMLGELAPHAG